MTDMLHSQHPWMHAYFHGKRGHMLERAPWSEPDPWKFVHATF
jgi:hypothetical protein